MAVDPNSGVTPSASVPAGNTSNVNGVTPQQKVASGFGSQNTVSQNSAVGQQSVAVSMNEPTDVNAKKEDLLYRSFVARFDGFRAAVHDFNKQFDAKDIDLNDTDSLMLLFKAMLSDTQAMVSAASIDVNYSARSAAQSKKASAASESLTLKEAIRSRTADIKQKQAEVEERNLEKNRLEHALANMGGAANNQTSQGTSQSTPNANQTGATSLSAPQMQLKISLLEHKIAGLSEEVKTLNEAIKNYQSKNDSDAKQVKDLYRVLNSVVEESAGVLSLLGRAHQRFDAAALETGEEEKEEAQVEGKASEAALNQLERKRVNKKEALEQVAKEQVKQEVRVDDKARFPDITGAQLLTVEDQQALKQVFGGRNEEDIKQALARIPEPRADLPPAEEGFAIALSSGLVDSNKEEVSQAEEKAMSPAEEKQYGDNLSLEGATNPQIHSRLWREKDFAEGQETQDIKAGELQESAGRTEVHRQSVAEALEDFQNIPLETAEMYEKQQEAARQISRNSRA